MAEVISATKKLTLEETIDAMFNKMYRVKLLDFMLDTEVGRIVVKRGAWYPEVIAIVDTFDKAWLEGDIMEKYSKYNPDFYISTGYSKDKHDECIVRFFTIYAICKAFTLRLTNKLVSGVTEYLPIGEDKNNISMVFMGYLRTHDLVFWRDTAEKYLASIFNKSHIYDKDIFRQLVETYLEKTNLYMELWKERGSALLNNMIEKCPSVFHFAEESGCGEFYDTLLSVVLKARGYENISNEDVKDFHREIFQDFMSPVCYIQVLMKYLDDNVQSKDE